MKKQTKKELIREFTDWVELGFPVMWYKTTDDLKWFHTTSPDWDRKFFWIISDERAEVRKKFADEKTVYAKDVCSSLVVEFDDIDSGIVVKSNGFRKKGYHSTMWSSIFEKEMWEILPDYQETALPQLDIDTKIIAWDNYDKEYRRYFSHFDKNEQIFVFKDGGTSWSTKEVETFENWKLAEEDKK